MGKKSKQRSKGRPLPSSAIMLALLPCVVIAIAKSGLLEKLWASRRGPTNQKFPVNPNQVPYVHQPDVERVKPRADTSAQDRSTPETRNSRLSGTQAQAMRVEVGAQGDFAMQEHTQPPSPTVPVEFTNCDDKDANCPAWQSAGECEANPGYMKVKCAFSCAT